MSSEPYSSSWRFEQILCRRFKVCMNVLNKQRCSRMMLLSVPSQRARSRFSANEHSRKKTVMREVKLEEEKEDASSFVMDTSASFDILSSLASRCLMASGIAEICREEASKDSSS